MLKKKTHMILSRDPGVFDKSISIHDNNSQKIMKRGTSLS